MLPYVHIHTGSKLTKMAVVYNYKLLYAAIFQDVQFESIKILILLLFCSLDIVSQVTIHGKVYTVYNIISIEIVESRSFPSIP